MVEVGERARGGIRSQVFLQPRNHRRVGTTTSHFAAHRIQGDYVPLPAVVGVVALGGVSGRRAEVAVVAGGSQRVVLVISYAGPGAGFVAAPGGVVAIGELATRAIFVGVVAGGVYGARYAA